MPGKDAFHRPLRDLRISVTDRCNFRCPYCMPEQFFPKDYAFLPAGERLSFEEILQVARTAVRLGVQKIRLTGGEPLLYPRLSRLVTDLRQIPGVEDIALTTNGLLLARQARDLRQAGLDRITVSLDALDERVFARMTGGRGRVEDVLAGIKAAQQAGFPGEIKVNMVVQRGVNDDQITLLAEYFRHSGVILRFIEYMDVGTRNGWSDKDVVTAQEILDILGRISPLKPLSPHYRGEVAKRYYYVDGGGEIGLCSSVSAPFCGTCTRARLSSDGKFYTCLFAEKGTDLRPVLRGDHSEDLEACLRQIWHERTDRYSEERFIRRDSPRGEGEAGEQTGHNRIEMNYIGG